MMRFFARLLFACLLLAGGLGAARAAEEIRSFDARIVVGADATLTVTERIAVNAEGRAISRGIFRDIPLRFEDASGATREVGLAVLSVKRDGRDEPFEVTRGSGVLRIRIGNPNRTLSRGVHEYEITYETTRQIRYFETHDELYWNVTGNGWDFPILSSRAEIQLPQGAQASDVTFYTGPYGSTEQAASAERRNGGNVVVVRADRRLGTREGLTAVVAFPKGVVAPPSEADLRADWMADNLGWIIAWCGLALVLAFYVWAWSRVGRDPPADIVVPRWTPPDGVSPALANYIERRGFRGQGWDAFSASILDLAVKGHLVLEEPKRTVTMRRVGSGMPSGIGTGQWAILKTLPQDGDALVINKANGETVQSIGKSFRKAMETEHRNRYYKANPGYLIGGVCLTLVVLVLVLVFGRFSEEAVASAAGAIIPAIVISIAAVNIGRQFRNARTLGARIMAVIVAAFFGLFFLGMMGGVTAFLTEFDFDPRVLAAVGGLAIANITFFYLMGAPTPVGQKLSAQVAGLKQYLTVAEKDRMNMQGAPEMSPKHFETLLPYAVALGVEKPWSRAFDAWLATAAATGAAVAAYHGPSWYSGRDFSPGDIGTGLGNLAGSLSSSFTASLPTPKSSSSGFSGGGGGGGGFSGGGGGGGGGGW